jgi:hypothetical protein
MFRRKIALTSTGAASRWRRECNGDFSPTIPSLCHNRAMIQPLRGISWLYKQTFGRALLLGFFSWVGLTLVWNQCQVGTAAFNLIAAIFRPGVQAGDYIAHLTSASRVAGSLLDFAGVVLFLASVWFVVFFIAQKMRTEKRLDNLSS